MINKYTISANASHAGTNAGINSVTVRPLPQKADQEYIFYKKNIRDIAKLCIKQFGKEKPKEWGLNIKGVKTQLDTREKLLALTFDACGQTYGHNDYDKELIDFLIKEKIPATLFITSKWINNHKNEFKELNKISLFDIEAHGFAHKPLSVNGKSAYGIKGTSDVRKLLEEISLNIIQLHELSGKKIKFFRSATAHYDNVAISILKDLGLNALNFNVNGDEGATLGRNQIKNILLNSLPGSIIIFHMNKPRGSTFEGIKEAIPILKKRGFKFVKACDYNVK